MELNVQAIYTTFMGEQNAFGIGAPVIFLRLGGCHLRCYKKTLGVLCDTPESLEKNSGVTTELDSLMTSINEISENSGGIKLICLTGGDPLWRHPEQINALLESLTEEGFFVVVETSGTLDFIPYMIDGVSFVIDYKGISSGINPDKNLGVKNYNFFRNEDYLKFVIYDNKDYEEMKNILVNELLPKKSLGSGRIVVGPYWGGKFNAVELCQMLEKDGLLGKVEINMQTHKMAVSCDYSTSIPEKI